MFEDKIGGVQIIMESQSGGHRNEGMKMSSAPNFRAPGGHIFDVVAQGLKNINLQPCLHSMQHRNYEYICGPQGVELTGTHTVDLKSIFDFSNITDF
jgi:hypothetical protein